MNLIGLILAVICWSDEGKNAVNALSTFLGRLPTPDKLKGTDAARGMDIFSLCLTSSLLSLFFWLSAKDSRGHVQEATLHISLEWKQDIIFFSKTFSTQTGKVVAWPLAWVLQDFSIMFLICDLMTLWHCLVVASFHVPCFNVLSLEVKRFSAEFRKQYIII